jgi:hypothetical protein
VDNRGYDGTDREVIQFQVNGKKIVRGIDKIVAEVWLDDPAEGQQILRDLEAAKKAGDDDPYRVAAAKHDFAARRCTS